VTGPAPTRFVVLASLIAATLGSACSSRREPEPSREVYREAVSAFYVGVSAMQTSQEVLARQKLDRVVALVPQEPAGWANLGLLLLRQQELDQGAEKLARAASLAPDNAPIQRLQALAESRRGNLAEAIRHWQHASSADPDDREAAFALALDTERQGGDENDAAAQRALEQLLARGDNLAARLEYARLAAKRGDRTALAAATAPLTEASRAWSPEAREQLQALLTAAASDNTRAAATRVAFLKNVLLREPSYRAALAEVSTPRAEVGQPLMRFVRLANPDPSPAPADEALTFALAPVADAPAGAVWAGAISLDGEAPPVVVSARASGVRVSGGAAETACAALGGGPSRAALPNSVAVADLNYDFRVDLAVAGPNGLCLLRQADGNRFTNVTAASKIPAALTRAPAAGVWAADVDTDGDLDLVLAPRDGQPIVLRNNGDGTFTTSQPFSSVTAARGFVWADLDGEGVPDAAILDEAGIVHVFVNLRGGSFRPEPLPSSIGHATAIAVLDSRGDSPFDLILLGQDGTLTRVSRSARDRSWSAVPLTRVEPPQGLSPGTAHLLTADLDNNAATDLIVAGPASSRILLGGASGAFTPLKAAVAMSVESAADLGGDGRLELIGLDASGRPARASIAGSKTYHWTSLRPRAATATGDQRINSFGIGGEIELRSGLHLQRQVVSSPIVHFGLGEAAGAEVARITWPNGVLQAEFDIAANRIVKASQRLKGSCPWLFAWNGREVSFVTDLLWRSPLGLRINAQATADTLMTEDWVKLRGDQLVPRDGAYDLRITAELWETHFFDLVSLMAVDHAIDTEIFVDERFAVPAPKLQIITTGHVQPFAAARTDQGTDVSDVAATTDSRYIDLAGRGAYQGITRPHFAEVELPEAAPRSGPLWLVATGWIHPTDSSINVAISQGTHDAPQGLSLQVTDATGRFHNAKSGLGFPAGKDKTILIDLSGLFGATGTRRLRLSTNLEIYWDRLGWAVGRAAAAIQTRRLSLASADLAYRGYSVTDQPAPSMPERPRYLLSGTAPRWLDLEGYYTRFGDVHELLGAVDDRYVIMNAGDELRLRFPEAPPPGPGLIRDFIAIADGWEKDGDFNTTFSRTVLPLPTHKTGRYDTPPGRLESDPIYRQHSGDFSEYHTRYVTSGPAREALTTPGRQ